MQGRSKLTYNQALALLARDAGWIDKLDRALGGGLLAAAPFTGGVSLGFLDPKSEAIALIRKLTGTAPGRIKAATGKAHYELLEASHTVLALSAFFDALREEVGPGYSKLELTDTDRLRAAGVAPTEKKTLPEELVSAGLPMPSSVRGFVENLAEVTAGFGRLFDSTLAFLDGLAAWELVRRGIDAGRLRDATTERAARHYRDRFIRLAADIAEFGFWMGAEEHAATRAAVDGAARRLELGQQAQLDSLQELHRLLSQTVSSDSHQIRQVAVKLANRAAEVLDERLWRAQNPPPGLTFPTVAEGFISPRFRIAEATKGSTPAREGWWDSRSVRTNLATFLAHYIADPSSCQRPLIMLGHPGAGKTLLTQVLAARLPPSAYTAVVIRLRAVHADDELHQQIEAALATATREQVSWGNLSRESRTTKVLIFDGFDELVQATGVMQSGYIERIARFQRAEWADGNPVVTIITSRTLVMDRARIPEDAVLVRLEEFDDDQVGRWVQAWNQANADTPSFRPLTAAELLRHGDLARQPLLTTLLAVYVADSGTDGLDVGDLSEAELYKRLLDSFISRQVRDKVDKEMSAAEQQQVAVGLRRDLAVAAFAMFNRGQQFIAEQDLERDLGSLSPERRPGDTGFGEPLDRATRTVAAFFFIYSAEADGHEETKTRRTYEFLHATFGEYLVAEHTVSLLRELAEDRERLQARLFSGRPDDAVFRALLAHQPLLKRQPIVEFAGSLLAAAPDDRDAVRQTALELLAHARDRKGFDPVEGYEPTPYDPMTRLAAYTANLVTLAALAGSEGVSAEQLSGRTYWESTVRLWRAGLDTEGQSRVLEGLRRSAEGVVTIGSAEPTPEGQHSTRPPSIDGSVARLVGDWVVDVWLTVGEAAWTRSPPSINAFQRDFHRNLIGLISHRWPVPNLRRLTPFDERAYRRLLDMAMAADTPIAADSAGMLLATLVDDAPFLAPDLLSGLVEVAVVRHEPVLSPLLVGLIAQCPFLLDRNPAIRERLEVEDVTTALTLLSAIRLLPHTTGPHQAIVADVVTRLSGRLDGSGFDVGLVSAEMVEVFAELIPSYGAMFELLRALSEYGDLAWSQIEPRHLAALLSRSLPDDSGPVENMLSILAQYLAAHGQTVTPTHLSEAVALIGDLAASETVVGGQGHPDGLELTSGAP